jgi:hypothetical protein
MMLTIAMARERNCQFGVNDFEPEFLLRPKVPLRLSNLDGSIWGEVCGIVDTGADACHIGVQLAEKIGLQPVAGPSVSVWSASGLIAVLPTLIDVEVLDTGGVAFPGFGRKWTVFYLQPGIKDIILGVSGFLDQFTEVRFDFKVGTLTLMA